AWALELGGRAADVTSWGPGGHAPKQQDPPPAIPGSGHRGRHARRGAAVRPEGLWFPGAGPAQRGGVRRGGGGGDGRHPGPAGHPGRRRPPRTLAPAPPLCPSILDLWCPTRGAARLLSRTQLQDRGERGPGYRAISVTRDSRTTVTRIWPG